MNIYSLSASLFIETDRYQNILSLRIERSMIQHSLDLGFYAQISIIDLLFFILYYSFNSKLEPYCTVVQET